MTDLKGLRLILGLRQIDVFLGTGIPVYRLSLAERELIRLTRSEEILLRKFLEERWHSLRQLELNQTR